MLVGADDLHVAGPAHVVLLSLDAVEPGLGADVQVIGQRVAEGGVDGAGDREVVVVVADVLGHRGDALHQRAVHLGDVCSGTPRWVMPARLGARIIILIISPRCQTG